MGLAAGNIFSSAEPAPTILIVDDEESIRHTLEEVFKDEGYSCVAAADGYSALQLIKKNRPDLVVLDIWMPGLDGIETLRQIKALAPDLPVIMISGHATIATAVTATRLGAHDFIEKPLDLNVTLNAAQRALGRGQSTLAPSSKVEYNEQSWSEKPWYAFQFDPNQLEQVVFASQRAPGPLVTQRTIARSVVLYGQGLHSGVKSGLILEPLPANSGIHFIGVSGKKAVPAHLDFVGSTGYATSIRLGQTQAATIEHLMSTLHAYGISNLLVKCNSEVPVMDGSALEFCELFDETGLEEQAGAWRSIAIDRTIRVQRNEKEFIQIEPADTFLVDYTLDYPEPVGKQRFVFELGDKELYKREIAPARTFGFVRDIGALQKQGLAQGGRFDNFVLIGEEGVVNTELRFADEMVRHKVLDMVGDLYLLGRPLRGKVTACMTGHSDNIELLKRIKCELLD